MNLKEANGRLKAGKFRLRIRQRGGRLSLRGTLPAKHGGGAWCQQEISLGINATKEGIRRAYDEARRLSVQLDLGEFQWVDKKNATVSELIALFKTEYFQNKELTQTTARTWEKDFYGVLKFLETPTMEAMKNLLLSKRANSRTRKRYAFALGRFADFLGLDGAELRALQGKYSTRQLTPRDIPNDRLILKTWENLPERLQWSFGVFACYGIRPSELYDLDFSERPMLKVKKGKTDRRVIFPLPPNWLERIGDGAPQRQHKPEAIALGT